MFKNFFDISNDLLGLIDASGFYSQLNPSFKQTLGYQIDELVSCSFMDLVHPDDVEKTKKSLDQAYEGKHVKFENKYKHKNGDYLLLSWQASVDTETKKLYVVAGDQTPLLHAEEKLKQVNDALNDHAITAVTDSKGIITEVNDNFCKISGYSKRELIGKSHRIVNSGKHSKGFWRNMWQTISSGKSWSGVITNKKKNGDQYIVYSIFYPIFDGEGNIENYLAVRFDMTNEINLEKSLSKTLQILQETSAMAKVGGWELLVRSKELNWTDQTYSLFEMNKTNDIKPRLEEALELYTPEYQNIIENAVQQCIERGKNYSLEALAVTAKGNKVWVHTSGHAHYEQNEITRITGTIQDINEKKLAEVKLYEEQKRSIQNAKLATMGELSAGLAHEINNPLTIILGNLKYFKKHISQSDTLEAKFNTIEKSCDRIQSITKNLVNHARKSRGDDVKSISVVSIAQEAITLTELKAKQTMTDIQLNSATQGEVMCNEVEIEQVLINLINNSIDAIKELDERWVKLDLSEKDNIIVIKVIDSGRAFSKEAAAQLFEPFYTTKERGQGTGLGLSITKKILENHNSSIHIDHESKNTCFVIRMPKHT